MGESIFDVVVCVLYDNSVAFVCLFDYDFLSCWMVLISSLERLGGLGCLRRGRSVISFCVFSKYSSNLVWWFPG